MARTLTQSEFEHMLITLKKEVFDARRFSQMTTSVEGSFQAFVENLGDCAYELNGRGIVCYANRATENVVGLPLDAIIGKAFLSLLKADCRRDGLDMLHRTLRGESTECTLTFTNGGVCHFKSDPMWDGYQKIAGICGIARDITDMKSAEQALLQANAELKKRLELVSHELVAANKQLAKHSQDQNYLDQRIGNTESAYCSAIIDTVDGQIE